MIITSKYWCFCLSVVFGRESMSTETGIRESEAYDGYSIALGARVYAFVGRQGDRIAEAMDFVSSGERQQVSRHEQRPKQYSCKNTGLC